MTLTPRARQWAATMHGHGTLEAPEPVRVAHPGGRHPVGMTAPLHREQREEVEQGTEFGLEFPVTRHVDQPFFVGALHSGGGHPGSGSAHAGPRSASAGGRQAQARTLAERAAELSGDDPLILAVLGAVHTFVRNHGTARVLLERALVLDPNAAWAWSRLGWLENYADRPERAIENFERALRLSPLDPMNFNNHVGMGSAHEVAEDYDNAAAHYRRALEERPHAVWIYRHLASSLAGAGRMEEAKEAYAEMMRNYPGLTGSKYTHAMVFSAPALARMVGNLRKLGLPD